MKIVVQAHDIAQGVPALPAEVEAGAVVGIAHCAGVVADRIIRNAGEFDTEKLNELTSAKLAGARNVLALFKSLGLDMDSRSRSSDKGGFCVLCSSSSVALGAIGQAVYCYANQYMDYL